MLISDNEKRSREEILALLKTDVHSKEYYRLLAAAEIEGYPNEGGR